MNRRSVATSVPRVAIQGESAAFGTFGELLQGALHDSDRDFLVTLPISCWSVARFIPYPSDCDVRVVPAHKTKSLALARDLVKEVVGPGMGGQLVIRSQLPEGKGLASSSADLVATARAVADALGLELTPASIERLLRRYEPSDGVMYPGSTAFYHREVRLREFLGPLPPLTIVAMDEGGIVDTIGFNRIPKQFTDLDKREYSHLLDLVVAAIRAGDSETIGFVATRSAVMNQKLHRKRLLEPLIELAGRTGALGVVVAHSGTAIGLLLAADRNDYQDRLQRARAECAAHFGDVTVYHSLGVSLDPDC